MSKAQKKFAVRSKVWIEDAQGNVVFGMGRYRMLVVIRETGSLNATAKALKMSYRAVWMRIRTSEERLGKRLVEPDGNGSRLTPFAEQLMARFEQLKAEVNRQSDTFFENLFAGAIHDAGPSA
ncbi:MAG: LysR family transcriptional regulator [Desulfobacteraceae bacterium]|nr:LysR family transcriptional regulator [Desulfobacteraceae bacterium]